MSRRSQARLLMLGALLGSLLSGCGATPGSYDPYSQAYGSGYGSDYGYGSSYGGSYDSGSYGSGNYSSGSYGSSYGSDSYSSGSYGSSYGGYDSGSYGSSYGSDMYGSGYGPSPRPSERPELKQEAPYIPPALQATVLDVKETGVLTLGKIVATVEVKNPTDKAMSGRVRVMFTSGGRRTPNEQTRRVTLAPHESKVFTFEAKPWSLDGAEASVDTDGASLGRSTVSDL